jgi:hypothetical protein
MTTTDHEGVEGVDARTIVQVLRILDRGWLDPIPDDLMPGLHFASWNDCIAENPGEVSKLSERGRVLLAKLGPLSPEATA